MDRNVHKQSRKCGNVPMFWPQKPATAIYLLAIFVPFEFTNLVRYTFVAILCYCHLSLIPHSHFCSICNTSVRNDEHRSKRASCMHVLSIYSNCEFESIRFTLNEQTKKSPNVHVSEFVYII